MPTLRSTSCALLGFLALAATPDVSPLRAQSATIGYSPVANLVSPTVLTFTGASLNANTAFVVPFQFNTLGDYSLTSASLLLAGNAHLGDFSLSVSSTLPTNLTPPTALTTFSATGTLNSTAAAYSFTSGASLTLAADTTYYFRVAYTGNDTANWIASAANGTGSTGSGGFVFVPVSGALLSTSNGYGGVLTSAVTYRSLTSGGFTNVQDAMGAFSITASAVSAIPEPSTYAALAGAVTLAAALYVRRRKDRTPAA